MNKVYDRVSWDFLEKVLQAYGFHTNWISSLMTLVSSVTYTYQVNGFNTRKVFPRRGLSQGYPLSAYLFILVFDVLSRLISEVASKDLIQGIKLAEYVPSLTHLFFADDDIVFSKDSPKEVFQITKTLNLLTNARGQKVNLSKSGIICGCKVDSSIRNRIVSITNIPIWANPGTYLGVLAECGGSKVQDLNWLKERVISKAEGWKGNLLKQARKFLLKL